MRKSVLTGAGAGLVAGVLAALNLLGGYAYFRLDASRGRIYSLSKASKDLVRGLEDPVHVKAYFSDNLPPEYQANRRYVESFLKEYALASKGRLDYRFVPLGGEKGDEGRREAMADGVQPIRFNIYSKEKLEMAEGMMGLSLRYLDQKETLPVVSDIAGLEYDLSSRIRKMSHKDKPVVAFVHGLGGLESGKLGARVKAVLEQSYQIEDVTLSFSTEPLPSRISALLLLAPTVAPTENQRFALDQFLLSGKPVFAALDTHRVDLQAFSSRALSKDHYDFLEPYGVRLTPENVLDEQNQKVQLMSQQGYLQIANIVDFPPMVLAAGPGLNAESPLTKSLESVVLPFVSPLAISSGSLRVTELARSSPLSWTRREDEGYAHISPFEGFKRDETDPKGPFVLAAAVEGRFKSAFKEPPKGFKGRFLAESEKDGRLLVVGTAKIVPIEAQVLPANQAFFLNIVDWMAQSPELIAIRSKPSEPPPLKPLPDAAKTLVRYANIFGPALLVLACGGLSWSRRSRWKAALAASAALP